MVVDPFYPRVMYLVVVGGRGYLVGVVENQLHSIQFESN